MAIALLLYEKNLMKFFSSTIFSVLITIQVFSQALDAKVFESIHFRFIGPEGNRAIAIAGEPGNPMISYLGAASGGLWKT